MKHTMLLVLIALIAALFTIGCSAAGEDAPQNIIDGDSTVDGDTNEATEADGDSQAEDGDTTEATEEESESETSDGDSTVDGDSNEGEQPETEEADTDTTPYICPGTKFVTGPAVTWLQSWATGEENPIDAAGTSCTCPESGCGQQPCAWLNPPRNSRITTSNGTCTTEGDDITLCYYMSPSPSQETYAPFVTPQGTKVCTHDGLYSGAHVEVDGDTDTVLPDGDSNEGEEEVDNTETADGDIVPDGDSDTTEAEQEADTEVPVNECLSNANCDDGQACTYDECVFLTSGNRCVRSNEANGSHCDPGVSFDDGYCYEGSCHGFNNCESNLDCPMIDNCNSQLCIMGECYPSESAPRPGITCDDDNPDTYSDVCNSNGVCEGTPNGQQTGFGTWALLFGMTNCPSWTVGIDHTGNESGPNAEHQEDSVCYSRTVGDNQAHSIWGHIDPWGTQPPAGMKVLCTTKYGTQYWTPWVQGNGGWWFVCSNDGH